ncbi:MAG: zinc carboxypeptidase [Lunatimonas sp.]|uniref:M14 family metallopeptidase n=1 Tax=Lunatimonas sp. TaxID=2060141 RepID=UPI00263B503B|nr:M14 family metallopeptidase [Lunatimonas sp.]MCC5937586.1 zinc carboxypeptidase [Lunatimonas sp.]
MKYFYVLLVSSMFLAVKGFPQAEGLDYYLPSGYTHDPSIPSPKSILGFEVGEWHASHDQVVNYFRVLAQTSDRVSLVEYGRTYEKRPLVMLVVTSPQNLRRLGEIKEQRRALRHSPEDANPENTPFVMYMGHSVHGNEASAIQASIVSAYHFASAEEVGAELENMVLLIDPAINPDGVNRFASWVNSHKSYNLNGDRNNRELNEAWPGGRTNHYWFDLNRDWLPVQHPESRGRIRQIQEWLPNLVLDFHEMGSDNTFFFQPGIPSRNNPLTPRRNIELTEQIAEYHARFLDEIGSLYYSKESFDDYYYGKGSTYPDVQGAVGILFEQASSRGHLQENQFGEISFPFTIRNQVRTALSSFEAAKEMRVEMNRYMAEFYRQAKEESNSDSNKAYIFGVNDDIARSHHLADILLHHDIRLFSLEEDIVVNGMSFEAGKSFIVPLEQPQYKLVKSMFETRTEFQDSLFYDVSSWNFPMAFQLNHQTLSSRIVNLANVEEIVKEVSFPEGSMIGAPGAYAYAFEWSEYYAPKAAYALMDKGYQLRVSHKPFRSQTGHDFARGSILVGKGNSQVSDQAFFSDMQQVARESGVTIHALPSGYTAGINLGSPSMSVLKKPEVALLVDRGVSASDAGEMWHLFDQRMDMPITLMPTDRFSGVDLGRYSVIILPTGSYGVLGKAGADKLKEWVQRGGTLIARGSAMSWLASQELASFSFVTEEPAPSTAAQRPYEHLAADRGAKVTGGAIFKATLDITHPLGYGYANPDLFVFKTGNQFLNPSKNPYANPLVYTDSPLASGYIHPSNLEKLKNTGVIQVATLGSGTIIGMVDNLNFRAFWFGTNKLFLNAVFFGHTIDAASGR